MESGEKRVGVGAVAVVFVAGVKRDGKMNDL